MGWSRVLLFIYIAINLIGFMIMGVDKYKAKKGRWRIPEKTFFLLALAGGSLGVLWGMYFFRHKTRHWQFKLGIPLIILVQVALLFWIVKSPLPFIV